MYETAQKIRKTEGKAISAAVFVPIDSAKESAEK